MIEPKQLKVPEKGIPKMDIIFAILLLVATLSTAFCVYQATRWNGIQAVDFGESAKFRTESIRATTTANTQVTIDVQLFMSGWMRYAKMIKLRQNSSKNDSGRSSSLHLRHGLRRLIARTRFPREHPLISRNTV